MAFGKIVISTLILVISIINGFEVFEDSFKDEMLCRKCGKGITSSKDFVSVPTIKALRQRNETVLANNDTLIQLFENPHGARFEVVATSNAEVQTLSQAYNEDSWFPGFSWTIVVCPRCLRHLGWKFDPIETDGDDGDDGDDGYNISFFGLILSHLIGSSFADSLVVQQRAYQS